jgi:4-diphosphocytidyl-2-C-methyl-D-erythritol kinase
MLESCRVLAPAKVNIGLNVFPRAENGYHNIESVFQTVPLCDVLVAERKKGAHGCSISCEGMELPKENTLTAAYTAFCAESGECEGVHVSLEKRIPHGAGLGGGSSDAASFVFALEKLFDVDLDSAALARIAGSVGSDVFFFLLASAPTRNVPGGVIETTGYAAGRNGCAIVTGRGQNVRSIAAREDIFFVLVCPDVHVSTKEAYSLLDDCYKMGYAVMVPPLSALEKMYRADAESWRFVNSFTEPVSRKFPRIGQALVDVAATGALFADMSGSGAAVFGVYPSREKAHNAFLLLNKSWERCYFIT